MEDLLGLNTGSRTVVDAKCGRWNPTAEQMKVLNDLFCSGLRTPTTEQIQRISAHLSSFGKIESKNVFYWFQNHKARERHGDKKRRRRTQDHHEQYAEDERTKQRARTKLLAYIKCDKESEHDNSTLMLEKDDYRSESETLELFPLKSYNYSLEAEKINLLSKEHWCKGRARENLPLDLRLSIL